MQKKKNQVLIGVKRNVREMLRLIAQKERRPISTQIELLAEQECRRLGIPIPAMPEIPEKV